MGGCRRWRGARVPARWGTSLVLDMFLFLMECVAPEVGSVEQVDLDSDLPTPLCWPSLLALRGPASQRS